MKTKEFFSSDALAEFIRRMHALIGVFIGPFIIIAAITGALYGIAFALEDWIYHDTLFVKKTETAMPLSEQVKAANELVKDSGDLLAVRPAASNSETTRVLYTAMNLGSSDFRTIFIDPNNLQVKADIITYGSSGAMPLRRTIDLLHRDLLLGQWGRWYSELAASWLWITGFTGLFLFYQRVKTRKFKSRNDYQVLVTKHACLGLFCFFGLIMLSITGLTWSEWAGENVSKIRTAFHWETPSINKKLVDKGMAAYDLSLFDKIEATARQSGINAKRIEIRPSNMEHIAWQVNEIERGLPTHVDAVAIDPATLKITSRAVFATYPLMAKLTRWGIDLHMGSLFGVVNQILLVIMSLAISGLGITGYMMWFKRKGWRRATGGYKSLYREFLKQPILNKMVISVSILFTGVVLPLFFVGLILFTLIEEGCYVYMFYKVERS